VYTQLKLTVYQVPPLEVHFFALLLESGSGGSSQREVEKLTLSALIWAAAFGL
jgi:hypothetical protein